MNRAVLHRNLILLWADHELVRNGTLLHNSVEGLCWR